MSYIISFERRGGNDYLLRTAFRKCRIARPEKLPLIRITYASNSNNRAVFLIRLGYCHVKMCDTPHKVNDISEEST